MVCGAHGTAATFYTDHALPSGVSLSADGHLQVRSPPISPPPFPPCPPLGQPSDP